MSADAGADAHGDTRDDAASGELVLVTGGSGYVGTHVISGLLRSGHRVRTTVRSHGSATSAAAGVRSAVAASGVDPGGRLDIVSADLTTDDGWDDAMAGCAHVHHVASPFPTVQPDNADELIG
ncbi:NAD-dependent epimerase/dehydratase family protein [Streptomyces asiaticus]